MKKLFLISGNYLLTGGMEKVLVKWTLGHLANNANEKAFIPRLPGMIRYITVNSSNIAITLSNNCKYNVTTNILKLMLFSYLCGKT